MDTQDIDALASEILGLINKYKHHPSVTLNALFYVTGSVVEQSFDYLSEVSYEEFYKQCCAAFVDQWAIAYATYAEKSGKEDVNLIDDIKDALDVLLENSGLGI